MERRTAAVIVGLVCLLASLTTAALAHTVIELAARANIGESAYAGYVHVAIAPALLAAAMLLTGLILIAVVSATTRRSHRDPVSAILAQLRRAPAGRSVFAVAAGGLAALVGIEFLEQQLSLGHIIGVVPALGGNVAIGLGIVVAAAALVAGLGLVTLRSLVSTTVDVVVALAAWIAAVLDALCPPPSILRLRQSREQHVPATSCLARGLGLRAPPPSA